MNDREREILLILQEESAEVIQAVSKVFRFGWDSTWNEQSNKEHLEEEVGDFLAMIYLMIDCGMIDSNATDTAKFNKIEKLKKWSSIFK